MLLVHCLLRHPEYLGDVLPRPPMAAGVGHLSSLSGLVQTTQRRGGLQTHSRVSTTRYRCQVGCCVHTSRLVDALALSRTLDTQSQDPESRTTSLRGRRRSTRSSVKRRSSWVASHEREIRTRRDLEASGCTTGWRWRGDPCTRRCGPRHAVARQARYRRSIVGHRTGGSHLP